MSTSPSNTTYCLDLTRLSSRVGLKTLSGVDRVELAYLRFLLATSWPLFSLIKSSRGYVLLDRVGSAQFLERFTKQKPWGPPDPLSRLTLRLSHSQKCRDSDLRRLAIAKSPRWRLEQLLTKHVQGPCHYLNVGHSNLSERVFKAFQALPQTMTTALIHDTIPLDFPEFQKIHTPERFRKRLRVVARFADNVICNSHQTQEDFNRHCLTFGRVPPSIVAHLGIEPLEQSINPTSRENLPKGIDPNRPFFVSIGTIEPRKNHQLLLDIWKNLNQSQPSETCPQLLIIGRRGWNNEAVFHQLNQHPNHVIECNNIADNALFPLLKASSGLLFPSFAEGFGLPPAEAAALNVPVLLSDLPIYREILGNYPIYLDPNHIPSWQKTILQISSEKTKYNKEQINQIRPISLPTWAQHFEHVFGSSR